jgi:hypothetical protein
MRTTTAKNMGILKYHQTSLISYEWGWPLACLDGLIKPNQASHQGARWTSSVSIPVLGLLIETSAVWTWCRSSFQDICRGLDNYSWAYLWLISHDLSHSVPLMIKLPFLSQFTIITFHGRIQGFWRAYKQPFWENVRDLLSKTTHSFSTSRPVISDLTLQWLMATSVTTGATQKLP